jgi:soluble lytic murein transglycosylase-like protein
MARFTVGLLFAIRLLTPTPAAAQEAPDPAPEGAGPAAAQAVPDVPGLIADAARRWGLDGARMLRVAWCESKLNPGATSRYGHRGVYQFDGATWRERAPLAGFSPDFAEAYDARENVEVAAATFAAGQWWRWTCR